MSSASVVQLTQGLKHLGAVVYDSFGYEHVCTGVFFNRGVPSLMFECYSQGCSEGVPIGDYREGMLLS